MLLGFHGEVKVADFGVAKARSRSYHTVSNTIKGKAPYMAPEQILGEAIDRRADVFSLGVLAVRGDDAHAAVLGLGERTSRCARSSTARFQIRRRAGPGYPPELARIVRSALAREPANRYQTARAMVDELDQLAHAQRWTMSRSAIGDLVRVVRARADAEPQTPTPPSRPSA